MLQYMPISLEGKLFKIQFYGLLLRCWQYPQVVQSEVEQLLQIMISILWQTLHPKRHNTVHYYLRLFWLDILLKDYALYYV